VTMLSRKQISNWARYQIKRLKENMQPPKSITALSSIFNDLPKVMRTTRNNRILQAADAAHAKCQNKRIIRKTNIPYTSEQREVLSKAWTRGFLSDSKHYGSLSKITGLTRKQISNWARLKINRGDTKCSPRMNVCVNSFFKQLSDIIQKDKRIIPSDELKKGSQILKINSQNLEHTRLYLRCNDVSNDPTVSTHLNNDCIVNTPKSLVFTGTHQLPKRDYQRRRWSSDKVISSKLSDFWMSPIKEWILRNTLKGTYEIHDRQLEDLASLTSSSRSEVTLYLLHQGWRMLPANSGIRYVRTEQKIFSETRNSVVKV